MGPRLIAFALFFGAISCYRLPTTVRPVHYDLKIFTNFDERNFTFAGDVRIQLDVLEDTNEIVLHSKNLVINDHGVTLTNDGAPSVNSIEYDKTNDFLKVQLTNSITKGSKYELVIPFEGLLQAGLVGYYRSSYKGENGLDEWLGVTQFEANYARRAFPCFDEPALKATFSVSLGREQGYSAISNMPLLETMPVQGRPGWFLDKFEKSVPMSTYLVGYMVSKFRYVESPKTNSNILFRIWARSAAVNQTLYAADIGPKILSYYSEYFDVPYPLPKQDMIAVPDFHSGAMENWGIITYRETALLYDPQISSISNKYRVASVVAHELAHQWFGNLVTMKWWTDLWLNEGFATYVATLGTNHIHPDWNILMEDSAGNLVDVFTLDALNTSHPISVPIGHPDDIAQIFDAIAYKKGSAILRMMNYFLGEDTFRQGVSNYLKKYKYKNAEQDDLWESLTEAAHKNNALTNDITVKRIMDSWTKQTGYPVIEVNRDYIGNTAHISQMRYTGIASRENTKQRWWIPLTYMTKDDSVSKQLRNIRWMRETQRREITDMPTSRNWVLFNIDMSGVYRVNYDNNNWELLIKALNTQNHENINPMNRFQLLTDSMDFAWTGQLNYSIALRLVQYVINEKDFIPWKGAFIGLGRMNMILKRTSDYGTFKRFIRLLVTPRYNEIGGLSTKQIDNPNQLDFVRHQSLISTWACRADVPTCKKHALQLFYKWMRSPNPNTDNGIPTDLRGEVYCTGINKGGEAEWDFLWDVYTKSNVASERDLILQSLACSSEVWVLTRYLEWSIKPDSGIRKQDASSVFGRVASSTVGYYVAKKFLKEKLVEIREYQKATPEQMGRYVQSIASQITSEEELNEFTGWVKNNNALLKEGNIAIKQALESAMIRLNWLRDYQRYVIGILENLMK